MKYNLLPILSLVLLSVSSKAQLPTVLQSGITLEQLATVHSFAARVDKDPITGNFVYITSDGNVYTLVPNGAGGYSETLTATKTDHTIEYLQGMCFKDADLFIVGNQRVDTTAYYGVVMKGTLGQNNSRTWTQVAKTELYPQGKTWYDHGFSGIMINPTKDSLYISSGSRTDHGEEQNNSGKYPGVREVPLTSCILRIPANANNLTLAADAGLLAPYFFADGTRNSFDMVFLKNGDLIAVDNSGDRDNSDELNWLRKGHHYGFPWVMGGDDTPMRYAGYDVSTDKLVNHKCGSYVRNFFYNDPNYPVPPSGVTFTPSIKNYGTVADKFRDPVTGSIRDASDEGTFITTFTSHRSPLGLVRDKDEVVADGMTGGVFMVSYTDGGDANGLHNGAPATLQDPSQDLVYLDLEKEPTGDNYKLTTKELIQGFKNPVDACMEQNFIYVIEYNISGNGRLWKVTLPKKVIGISSLQESKVKIWPNPANDQLFIESIESPVKIRISDLTGREIEHLEGTSGKREIDISGIANGTYIVNLLSEKENQTQKLIINR